MRTSNACVERLRALSDLWPHREGHGLSVNRLSWSLMRAKEHHTWGDINVEGMRSGPLSYGGRQ